MAIRLAAYTAVLYAGLVHNALCAPEDVLTTRGEFRPGHQTPDCSLVVNRLRLDGAGPWDPLSWWDWGAKPVPYRSQFGFQGVVLAGLCRATDSDPERFAAAAGRAFGLATAAVLAAFFAAVAVRVGPLAGHVGVLLTACCPPLLYFAPSVYWSLPLVLGPFVFAWLAYPWAIRSTGRFIAFLTGLVALVCLKGLCGYEYITTVILAPAAAAVYHRAAVGDGLRRWLRPAAVAVAAGLVGFAAAVALHAAQLTALTGENGFAVIRDRAALRTGVPGDGERAALGYPLYVPELAFLPERVRLPVRCFVNYFYLPAVGSPQTWGSARFTLSLAAVLAAGALALAGLWRLRARVLHAAALAPAAVAGLVAALSWQVLAVNHMCYHGHMNSVVFCVPLLPLVFAGLGAVAQLAADRTGRGRLVSAAVVLAAVTAVSANAAVVSVRSAAREADRVRAVERVRAVLRGEEAAVGLAGYGPAPLVTPLPADPPYLPHGAMFMACYRPTVPADRTPVGATGWVLLPRESSGVAPLVVVAVRRGEVVESAAGYFRCSGTERVFGHQAAVVGYQVAIPPGESPRLFAVPTRPGLPVIELTGGR